MSNPAATSDNGVTASEATAYIAAAFDGVETSDAFGYTFFFFGADRMRPFATLAAADNDYDKVSDLNRPGVYRLNIGVGRQTFQSLFGANKIDIGAHDFSALDRIMPHPDYAAQHFVCVLSPSAATFESVKRLLSEAHALAKQRQSKRAT